ncbi:DNA invertase Pin-like site-specific DNA recombinase [Kribbella aluminosa]|uniref:DNA invertase Pin-like site-specific DNA recombinase n=1 Tax=Kribbella aluminosa TaxID=416017 RepID=A0ABS4ULL0_9ACTN|nr:recombinase family protein [Kribbella aluminosa]MBP2352480.1 DNA invertase Pin-like site-specific DNA recombinase [Kribbella aluminosa]
MGTVEYLTGADGRERSILLGRLSDNREDLDLTDEGIPAALGDQIFRMEQKSDELGCVVWKVIKNPRLSAYKTRLVTLPDGRREYRVWRPDLREAMDDLAAGRATVLIALDLDRAFRDSRDLQDLIDLVEHSPYPIRVESVTGSLRLEKGRDNFDAEIRVLVANKSSRDTARRVSNARERQARAGRFGGGKRPFGFCGGAPKVPDGEDHDLYVCPFHGGRTCSAGETPIDFEYDIIEDLSYRALQGVSLASMAEELRDSDVSTVSGAPWSAEVLKDILIRPRNAGLMKFQGEILDGVKAVWPEIIPREVFEAVVLKLTDPDRVTNPGGPAEKWMGTGVYRCGKCTPLDAQGFAPDADKPVRMKVTVAGRLPRYCCKARNHLTRNVAHTDRFVQSRLFAAFTHPKAYELLQEPAPEIDAVALRSERTGIRDALDQLAADEVLKLRTRRQVQAGTKAGMARIAEIDEALNASVSSDPLAYIINAVDPIATFEALPVANKRIIIDRLLTVTILPTGRRGSGFDPNGVHIEPKHKLDIVYVD